MSEHEELSARRPYNAAADFVDGNVARGNGGKVAFKEKDRTLNLWRAAGGELPVRARPGEAGAECRKPHRSPAPRHHRVSDRVLGRDPRRCNPHSAEYAADAGAIRLHHRGQPRGSDPDLAAAREFHSAHSRSPHLAQARDRVGRRQGNAQARQAQGAALRRRACGRNAAGVARADDLRRSRVLALLIGLDRRAEGNAAHPIEPDGDGETVRPGRHGDQTRRCGVLGGKAFLRLWPR